jgi:uncharacterized membrane protein
MSAPKIRRADWLVPAGLIFLGLVPVIAGAARLSSLVMGAEVTPENARFFASPMPVALHVVGAILFALLGALQFSAGLRRRRPALHRLMGRIAVVAGLVVALTGLWMTLFYPWANNDGEAVYAMRLLFGVAMLASIVLGFAAIRRRDIASHQAWMMRGYAIGMGAGTQVFTHLPWFIFASTAPGELPRAVMMGAGWVINLAVVEWIVRRPAPQAGARRSQALVRPA